jgi:hypothetical protein
VMAGDVTPLAISAAGQQLGVELVEVPRLRNRHPVIAPEVAGLAFDSALGVSSRMQTARVMRSEAGFG